MNIADAVRQIGYEEGPDEDLCIARIKQGQQGRIVQATLAQCADRDLSTLGDVYIATGAFRPGSITAHAGRTRDNLTRIVDLPFDFDLTDYLGLPKEDITACEDAELAAHLTALREDAGEVLSMLAVPVTLWIETGYGLLALCRIATPDQTRLDDAIALHAHLVERINAVAGFTLADPQVKDAGTRIVRLPGGVNTKGAVPRPCRIIEEAGDRFVHLDEFDVQARTPRPPRRIIPDHANELDGETERLIVLALNEVWDEGSRHAIALGVSGMLAKAGVPEAQAERIIAACAAGDPEGRDRMTAVRTSYERVRSGLQVAGFMRLRDVIPPEVLQFIDARLSAIRPVDLGEIRLDDGRREGGARSRPALPPLPEEALFGWFGEYVRTMAPTTSAPDAFHLACALTYAGALIGRDIATELGERLYPNLFVMLVGSTGRAKKTTAMTRAERFFDGSAGADDLYYRPFSVLDGATSGEGIIDQLRETPRLVLAESEFSTMIRRARRSGTLSLMPTLCNLYDMRRVNIMRASKAGLPPLEAYCFSLIGGATPKTLSRDMSSEDIESGFANRVLWVFGEGKGWLPNPAIPDRARCAWLLRELVEAISACPPTLAKDSAAMEFWMEWGRQHEEREYETEEEGEVAARLGTNLHKIATLHAATEGAAAIGERHITAAAALVDWSFAVIREQSRRWGATDESRLAGAIRDVLWSGPADWLTIARCVGERVEPTLLERTMNAMVHTGQVCMPTKGYYCLPEGG